MNKMSWGVLLFAIVAVFVMPVGAQVPNEVYLVPQDSNATYGNTMDVAIWVNAADFQGGQINLTYDSTCADVTNWVQNTTNFGMGGWEHYEGRGWIHFVETVAPLTGEYMIGTLTIQCVNNSQDGCETALTFVAPSKLSDDMGNLITATWIDGTFRGSPTADPIPEFPTLAIPVAAIIGLLLLIRRRRHE